jgi:hypothetical protein
MQHFALEGEFGVEHPQGVAPGTPIDMPVAFNFPPQPFPPGGRYEFRLWIDGRTTDEWRLGFTMRPMVADVDAEVA